MTTSINDTLARGIAKRLYDDCVSAHTTLHNGIHAGDRPAKSLAWLKSIIRDMKRLAGPFFLGSTITGKGKHARATVFLLSPIRLTDDTETRAGLGVGIMKFFARGYRTEVLKPRIRISQHAVERFIYRAKTATTRAVVRGIETPLLGLLRGAVMGKYPNECELKLATETGFFIGLTDESSITVTTYIDSSNMSDEKFAEWTDCNERGVSV